MDAPSFLPPNIVIVGRPNVGKSTLINAICGRRVVITDATPGTTRDRVSIRARHAGVPFNIIDTGGITDEVGSPIDTAVRHQVDLALAQAAVVVFVCDVRDGVTSIDREIAEMLRKCGRPVVVCANKVDSQRHESTAGEFFGLGFGAPVLISAVQRLSISDLLDRVFEVLHIDAVAIRQQLRGTKHLPPMKLAIVGRQNVGKSTLVNALAGEERVIVSEIAGTTRDSVDVSFQWQGHEFIAIDTAGLRKKGRVEDPIEYHSRMRTDVSIKRADVVLFLIDSAMRVTDVDKKIAGEVDEMAKPVVIGINKYDLVEEHNETKKLVDMNDYSKYISRTLPTLAYAPISLISALRGKNVFETVSTALDLYTQAHERIPTSQLNQVIERAKDWPGPRARHRGKAKIYYATQTRVAPPTIVLFVNDPALFPDDYRRNLANKFRAEMIYPEIPIRLEFAKHRKGAGKRKERSAEPEEPYESEAPPAAASPAPRSPADAVAETPREDPS